MSQVVERVVVRDTRRVELNQSNGGEQHNGRHRSAHYTAVRTRFHGDHPLSARSSGLER